MKEFVEKLIKTFKCEELRTELIAVGDVISIVNQLAEEHKECFKMCSNDCEVYDKEKHYCPKWCKLIRETVAELKEEYNQDSTEKNQGWISCSERLPDIYDYPEQNNRVLVSYDDGIVRNTDIKTLVYGRTEYSKSGVIKPIAWMPLPEAYKLEEKQKFSNEELDTIMDKILNSQEPKTRIDHIRSMSVEEMADKILDSPCSAEIDFCQNFEQCYENVPEEKCRECLIKYLNSPVKQKKVIPTNYYMERFTEVV